LARQTGKTVRAIHLYEELGLLQPATRSSGGFRLYEHVAVDRLRWIDLFHTLGFSLNEMRDVIAAWWGSGVGPDAMTELRTLFQHKLAATREAIANHHRLERELLEGLAYLETCKQCNSPDDVHGCVHCSQDHGMSQEPALVAGITTAPEPRPGSARPQLVRLEDIG
jgi:DNA-binding transcriptional MerR regulator